MVDRAFHFNALGALGWWFNGQILRRKVLPGNQLRLFNLMTPVLRLESWFRLPFGLSLVVTAHHGAPLRHEEAAPAQVAVTVETP